MIENHKTTQVGLFEDLFVHFVNVNSVALLSEHQVQRIPDFIYVYLLSIIHRVAGIIIYYIAGSISYPWSCIGTTYITYTIALLTLLNITPLTYT